MQHADRRPETASTRRQFQGSAKGQKRERGVIATNFILELLCLLRCLCQETVEWLRACAFSRGFRPKMSQLPILAAHCKVTIPANTLGPEEQRAAVWTFLVHGAEIVSVCALVSVVLNAHYSSPGCESLCTTHRAGMSNAVVTFLEETRWNPLGYFVTRRARGIHIRTQGPQLISYLHKRSCRSI